MDNTPNGLAALLGQTLGAQWRHLHPDIRARFTLAPGATRQRFTGSMSTIERSCIGWLIARLIAFMHVLPSVRARDVPFEFNLTATSDAGWIKERLYHFREGRFEFRSVMRVEAAGELIENFPYGLCMKIKLVAEGDTLFFLDDGYFVRIGKFRLPIPRWASVGRFTLTHTNIDRENFTVAIRLDHPLFGRLFYQCGRFVESRLRANPNERPALTALTSNAPAPASPFVAWQALLRHIGLGTGR